MTRFWSYERIEHDDGEIVYEVQEPWPCHDTESSFSIFKGVDARSYAAKFCAMMNREEIKKGEH